MQMEKYFQIEKKLLVTSFIFKEYENKVTNELANEQKSL